MNRRLTSITLTLALVLAGTLSSCRDYSDDLLRIGERVTALEQQDLKFDHDYQQLMTIIGIMQGQNPIQNVTQNADGSWTIDFVDAATAPITLTDGVQGPAGKEIDTALLSVRDSTNGKTYWTLNGEWLRNSNGNAIEVIVKTGNDGHGADPTTMPVPIIRINPDTGIYEYTSDTYYDRTLGTWRALGNAHWIETGIKAKGEQGEQGDTGGRGDDGKATINENGDPAPYYYYITDDGRYLIFVTSEGSFAVELLNIS